MSLFEYQAFSSGKKKINGIINASSLEEAKAILYQKSLVIFRISAVKEKKGNLTKKEVLFIIQQTENLLSAGIPLYESMLILANKSEKKKVKLLLLDLCEKIKSGYSLSEAMRTHPKSFDLIICSMIENAQKTGKLEDCLNEIAKILNSSLQLKKRLISAFTYPLVLLGFCFVVLNFLLFFTIPSLFDLFEGRQLHPFTKMVFFTSKSVCKYKYFILSGFILLFVLGLACCFYEPVKKKIYGKFLKFPVFKSFMIKVSLIRFCISFANLLKGGESYVNSLVLAANVLKHPVLEAQIIPLKDKLIEGKHLSQLLENNEYIPEIVPKMLSIAEETSQMPKMLLNIAKIYEDEVERFLSKITSIFQPVMLIILGLIVGFVVLSVLIPLTDVSSFIGEEKL